MVQSLARALPLVAALPTVVPALVAAQVPVITRGIGPWSVSATVGTRGVDVRIGSRSRASPSGKPTTRASTKEGTTVTSTRAASVLGTAKRYVGTPYRWGGTSPKSGFDCSGFVQYVFGRNGVDLPRPSRRQARVGQRVPVTLAALRPGDLMMFASDGDRIDHVAIYAGDDRIIHSSSSGHGVRYDKLHGKRGSWFVRHH